MLLVFNYIHAQGFEGPLHPFEVLGDLAAAPVRRRRIFGRLTTAVRTGGQVNRARHAAGVFRTLAETTTDNENAH